MERQNEIIIHENQTVIDDFIEDINDKDIFKCKKCSWLSSNKNIEFLCINPISDFENKCVRYCKGCDDYYNPNEVFISNILDDETKSLF